MHPKTFLRITCFVSLFFSSVMFIAPKFVTREQFPNAKGQGFEDLVTFSDVIVSLTLALVLVTYNLHKNEELPFQSHVMKGYSLAFRIVFLTTVVLHSLGKDSSLPPIVGTGIIALLSLIRWRDLRCTIAAG